MDKAYPGLDRRTNRKLEQEAYRLASQEPHVVSLTRGARPYQMIDGRQGAFDEELGPIRVRHNVTLVHGGRTVLQRLGPITESASRRQGKQEREGYGLFQQMDKECTRMNSHAGARRVSAKGLARFHLGIWYDQACRRLCPTKGMEQPTPEAEKAMARFLRWLHTYLDQIVAPLVRKYADQDFAEALQERSTTLADWLCRITPYAEYCHPLASTFAAFEGFTDKAHTDPLDQAPTILLNFGAHALLKLPEFSKYLELQPGDVVLFRSDVLKHTTKALPLRVGEKRWAVSCFWRKRLAQRRGPTNRQLSFLFAWREVRAGRRAKGKQCR